VRGKDTLHSNGVCPRLDAVHAATSDLPGVNPATLNGMILYYCLMTKKSGLGDSNELSRVGLSQ
jgi:hypothetical protein